MQQGSFRLGSASLLAFAGLGLGIFACKGTPSSVKQEIAPVAPSLSEKNAKFDNLLKNPSEIDASVTDSVERAKAGVRSRHLAEGTGCEKLDALWASIYETAEAEDDLAPLAKDNLAGFLSGTSQRLWQSFVNFRKKDSGEAFNSNDIAPADHLRLTHRHGVFVKLGFVAEGRNEYTGLFKGSECVLGRLSSAVSPGTTRSRGQKYNLFTPGFAAKFFVDGKNDSPSLIAQHSIAGQGGNMNYFHYALSNKLKFELNNMDGVPAFSRFFNTLQDFAAPLLGSFDAAKAFGPLDPRELSVSPLSIIDSKGKASSKANAPRYIYLVKSSDMSAYQYPLTIPAAGDSAEDYRIPLLNLNKNLKLNAKADASGAVENGPKLFDVYASDEFVDLMVDGKFNRNAKVKKIGSFQIKSKFVASDVADLRVFFKHSIEPRKIDEKDYSTPSYSPPEFHHSNFRRLAL